MTASPTQTPSPTTVPDVLLYFSVAIAPASTSGTSLSANFVAQQLGFLRSAANAYAGLLGVPASQVYATNVSDRATGAFVVLVRQRTGNSGAFTHATGADFSDCVGDGAAGVLLAGFAAVAALSLPLTLAVAVIARKLPLLRDLL